MSVVEAWGIRQKLVGNTGDAALNKAGLLKVALSGIKWHFKLSTV